MHNLITLIFPLKAVRIKKFISSSSVNGSYKTDMDMSLEELIAIVGSSQSQELIMTFINAKTEALKIQADKEISLAKINASNSLVIFFLYS